MGLFARTLGISCAVTLLALLVGIPLGALLARARMTARGIAIALHATPLLLPPMFVALGTERLLAALGAGTGWLFGEAGVVVVLATALTPIVTGLTFLGVTEQDPTHEEAALLGATPLRVLFSLSVPAARNRIVSAALIVMTLSLCDAQVSMYLRVPMYSALLFSRLGGTTYAPREAFLLSLPLLVASLLLFAAELRVRESTDAGPRRHHVDRMDLGPAPGTIVLAVGALSFLPVAAVLLSGIPGVPLLQAWLGDSVQNSLLVSMASGLVLVPLGLAIAHARSRGWLSGRVVAALMLAGFFVPSAITGSGLRVLLSSARTEAIYGSMAIVVLGLLARYATLSERVLFGAIARTSPNFEDAAQIAGASYVRRLVRIVAPMNARALVFAGAATVVFALRDLETVVLSYPPGGDTLTVRIFTLDANGPKDVVSALAGVQVVLTAAIVGVAALGLRRTR